MCICCVVLCVSICIVWWHTLHVDVCIMLCCIVDVGVCVVCQVYVHVLHGFVCHVWFYVYDSHYVYVQMVEEKSLGDFRVWKPIQIS